MCEGGLYYILVPRKASRRLNYLVTVPQTNTRGLVENTKTNGINMLKELGKSTVVTSG